MLLSLAVMNKGSAVIHHLRCGANSQAGAKILGDEFTAQLNMYSCVKVWRTKSVEEGLSVFKYNSIHIAKK